MVPETENLVAMAKLSTADNVEATASTVLREKGFELHVIDVAAGKPPLLVARDKDHEFRAHSALEILGLLAVFEARGDDWQPSEEDEHHRTKFWDGLDDETDQDT